MIMNRWKELLMKMEELLAFGIPLHMLVSQFILSSFLSFLEYFYYVYCYYWENVFNKKVMFWWAFTHFNQVIG